MRVNKKVVYILTVGVLLIVFTTAAFLLTMEHINYYSQIDNRWGTEIAPHGNMYYKYTLDAYDEKSSKKNITFETGKKLREGAFICLKVAPIRGVVSWADVQYDELPSNIQMKYSN